MMGAPLDLVRRKSFVDSRIGGRGLVHESHQSPHGRGQGTVVVDGNGPGPPYPFFHDKPRFQKSIDLAHNGGLVDVDRSRQLRQCSRPCRKEEQLNEKLLLGVRAEDGEDILHITQYILHITHSKGYNYAPSMPEKPETPSDRDGPRRPGRTATGRGRAGRSPGRRPTAAARSDAYRHLINPFEPARVLSDDQVGHIHEAALGVLEDLGMRVLLPAARSILADGGASVGVGDDDAMVRLDRGLVEWAVDSAPSEFDGYGGSEARNVRFGGRNVVFAPVGGPPYVSDRDRGRRPGTIEAFEDLMRLAQSFDVLHIHSPSVEPQDVEPAFRHYRTGRAQLVLSDKMPFFFGRGTPQIDDAFEMVRIMRGLTAAEFSEQPYTYTVVNTNSPRQLDIPMAQAIVDFAKAGQIVMVTPFTLSGAMAPISLAGALTQQHAEALFGITLSQLVRPGAPVVYGGFTSNVDMRSGAPAFGTPEYVKAAIASGQLTRHVGIPFRSSNVNASNAPDAQAAYESMMSSWGALMGGANVLMHAAGWLEGGLVASMEKYVIDVEALQTFAEMFLPMDTSEPELARAAMEEVGPGGHYFGAGHTMERYATAFYEPLVSDWSNHGQWAESGSPTTAENATGVWKRALEDFEPPSIDPARVEALDYFIQRRTRAGGAPPVST